MSLEVSSNLYDSFILIYYIILISFFPICYLPVIDYFKPTLFGALCFYKMYLMSFLLPCPAVLRSFFCLPLFQSSLHQFF